MEHERRSRKDKDVKKYFIRRKIFQVDFSKT